MKITDKISSFNRKQKYTYFENSIKFTPYSKVLDVGFTNTESGVANYNPSNITKLGIDEKDVFEKFIKEKYADGEKAEDINEITGYDPAKAKCEEGNFNEYGNKVTYTKEGETKLSSRTTNGKKWSGTQSTLNYYDKSNKTFKTLTSGSTQITSTYYYYNPTTLNTKQEKPTQGVDENGVYNTIYQILFGKYAVNTDSYEISFVGTGTQPRYWLASESANTVTNGVNWGLRRVNDGKVYNRGIYFSSGTEYSYDDFGVRPIVYLKSDISLEWNNTLQKWKIK